MTYITFYTSLFNLMGKYTLECNCDDCKDLEKEEEKVKKILEGMGYDEVKKYINLMLKYQSHLFTKCGSSIILKVLSNYFSRENIDTLNQVYKDVIFYENHIKLLTLINNKKEIEREVSKILIKNQNEKGLSKKIMEFYF